MEPVGNSPQALSRDECLDLLRSTGLGRVAYSQRALPAIVIAGYAVVGDAVLLRLDAAAPELASLRNAVVAFQTDGADAASRSGWSVTCVGRARPVADASEVEHLVPLVPATAGEAAAALLRLEPELVEGRRFHELQMTSPRQLSGAAAPAT